MKTLLKNCRLIPELSDGYENTFANVVIENDKIEGIYSLTQSISTDKVYDCEGMTLLPGLFDLHMHLNWAYYNGEIDITDFKLFTQSCFSAKQYLEYGITTIRDLGTPKRVSLAVRSAIQNGLFLGPRIISGGMIIRPVSKAQLPNRNCFLRFVSGSEDMTKIAREEIGEGADFLKLYVPGDPPQMLPEEVRAAVRIAKIHRKRVAAHAHDTSAINLCIDEGVDTIEHGSFIDQAAIKKLKTEKSFLVPTLSVLSPVVDVPGIPRDKKSDFLGPLLEANAINIKAAYDAGLKLGFGTDTPIESFEKTIGLEFKMRKEYCGMKNIDMLLQATKYSALITGLADITGEIKEGLAADLILVNGNPDENIEAMYQTPKLVFVNGEKYK